VTRESHDWATLPTIATPPTPHLGSDLVHTISADVKEIASVRLPHVQVTYLSWGAVFLTTGAIGSRPAKRSLVPRAAESP
jgi:hypothetical protein